jgi:cell wall-associated NlpC family hydrolase
VITVLRPGQSVNTRSGSTSGWQAVVCGGQNGFVSSQFVTSGSTSTPEQPKDPAPAPAPAPSGLQNGDHAKTTASLNLRYDASLGSGVAAVAPAGTVILITGSASNGFHPVDWDGLKGYMSGDYLTETSAALSERGGSAQPAPSNPPTSGGGTATGNAMVDYAMRYLGYPYVWATHGPASFDCSGFTYWVAQNVMGVNIGYGTWTQVSAGTRVSRDNLQPGDLVFFQNTYTAGLSHVGLYIGNGQFIHAENENTGVRISDLNSTYYGSRWYGAVRL